MYETMQSYLTYIIYLLQHGGPVIGIPNVLAKTNLGPIVADAQKQDVVYPCALGCC